MTERSTSAARPAARSILTGLLAGAMVLLPAACASPRTDGVAVTATQAVPTQRMSDHSAVERAVLDYVEGFYEADSVKLFRSVWPEVRKYGYWRRAPGEQYAGVALPFEDFMDVARDVRGDGNRVPADAPKDVVIFEVQDQTASAKVTAIWGTDYLLLARERGRWMITHVLWQGPLAERP